VLLLAASPAFAAHSRSSAALTGSITVSDRWVCHSPVALDSVTVTNPTGDAVELGQGCTGTIGAINVPHEVHGDPIHVGAAFNLKVSSVTLGCQGHDVGKHQDGIQVMGGQNVSFLGGTIACWSANDSQFMVHPGVNNNNPPNNILFANITVSPEAGMHPGYSGGAYGMSLGSGSNLRVDHVTLLTHANRHDCYIGTGATNATFTNMTGAGWVTHTGKC